MNVEYFLKSNKRIVHNPIKSIVSLLIITALMTPIIPVQAEIKKISDHPEAYWKHYPYYPPGTDIVFPIDEGAHDTQQFPIEWWYVNFHLTGQTTGDEYGSFVAFYKIQTNVADKKEIRIFSISDLTNEKTYTDIKIGTLTASSEHLDLSFQYLTDNYEIESHSTSEDFNKYFDSQNQVLIMESENTETPMKLSSQNKTLGTTQSGYIETTNTTDEITMDEKYTEQIVQLDNWYTKSNNQGLLPFQYSLIINGNSQQDHKLMTLNIDMNSIKKPLVVGGDGIIELGVDQRLSYYYCLSKLEVTGYITVNERTEYVTGFAWIDHQWGDFFSQNPPPYRLVVSYEWFSIKLNDNREIMVGDTWDINTGEKINQSFSSGLNLFNSDESLELLENFTIVPECYWYDKKTHNTYSAQWRIIELSKQINLTITPIYNDQMMRIAEEYPLIQQILELISPGACFWEGVCIVTGKISGIDVQGNAYVELTHRHNNKNIID